MPLRGPPGQQPGRPAMQGALSRLHSSRAAGSSPVRGRWTFALAPALSPAWITQRLGLQRGSQVQPLPRHLPREQHAPDPRRSSRVLHSHSLAGPSGPCTFDPSSPLPLISQAEVLLDHHFQILAQTVSPTWIRMARCNTGCPVTYEFQINNK